jgi:acetyl esterase/lipase
LKEFPEEYRHEIISYKQNADVPILGQKSVDMFMGKAFLFWLYRIMLTDHTEAYKPDNKSHLFNIYAAPYNFKGLPPTFFQICGMDPLRDEAILYERLLRENYDTKTSIKLYPGLPHGFWSFCPTLKSSKGFVEDTVEGVSWLLKQK